MSKIITKILIISVLVFANTLVMSAQLDYQFNSPSFNGNGYGTYVLTVKQLEDQAKTANKAAADALAQQAATASANTPQAQFVASLQSRIYSQLALNITNTLFGATGQPNCGNNCGGTMDIGGNTMSWSLNSAKQTISIRIINNTNPNQYTNMTVPIGTFAF